MPWVAAVAAVAGTVIGGVMSNDAAEDATSAQVGAADRASAEARRQFDVVREDTRPYREAGVTALGDITQGLGDGGEFNRNFTMQDFTEDPGYAFRLAEGERALSRSIAAGSGVLSGSAVQAGINYSSGMASQEYGAAWDRFQNERTGKFNRLATVAGIGQTGLNASTQAGESMVDRVNSAGYGGANATGALAGARANNNAGIVNGITSAFNNYAAYRNYGGGGGGTGYGDAVGNTGYRIGIGYG